MKASTTQPSHQSCKEPAFLKLFQMKGLFRILSFAKLLCGKNCHGLKRLQVASTTARKLGLARPYVWPPFGHDASWYHRDALELTVYQSNFDGHKFHVLIIL
jgi:hypothetical protein